MRLVLVLALLVLAACPTTTPVCTDLFPGGTICNSSNYCY